MDFNKLHSVYFIGIGGIGMSALARFFHTKGKFVAGYDRTPSELTGELIKTGIQVHYKDDVEEIPGPVKNAKDKNRVLIVYTPAIPEKHSELNFLKTSGYIIKKRSEVLGIIVSNEKGIAIAGTHGKTTVSTLVAHVLYQSSLKCNAFLGGIAKNYSSNYIFSEASELFVAEADEYDRSFLQLHPEIGAITAIDPDHLDIYGEHAELAKAFYQFIKQIKKGGTIVHKKSLEIDKKLNSEIKWFTYAIDDKNADFYAENITIDDGIFCFDIHTPQGVIKGFRFGMPGRVNVENAVAAVAICQMAGAKKTELLEGIHSFRGIKRRFDFQIRRNDLVYIDDYAHHPVELKACISAVRELYPKRKITGVFQPHLFSRTFDFAEGFAKSLELLDELILMDIYPAREEPVKGVTSELIFKKVNMKNKTLCKYEETVELLKEKDIDVLLTLGAGDIDRLVEPIRKMLITS